MAESAGTNGSAGKTAAAPTPPVNATPSDDPLPPDPGAACDPLRLLPPAFDMSTNEQALPPLQRYRLGEFVDVRSEAGTPPTFRGLIVGAWLRHQDGKIDYCIQDEAGYRTDGYFEDWLSPEAVRETPPAEPIPPPTPAG